MLYRRSSLPPYVSKADNVLYGANVVSFAGVPNTPDAYDVGDVAYNNYWSEEAVPDQDDVQNFDEYPNTYPTRYSDGSNVANVPNYPNAYPTDLAYNMSEV